MDGALYGRWTAEQLNSYCKVGSADEEVTDRATNPQDDVEHIQLTQRGQDGVTSDRQKMRQRVMNELAGCHPYDSCLALQLLWGVLLIIDDELVNRVV